MMQPQRATRPPNAAIRRHREQTPNLHRRHHRLSHARLARVRQNGPGHVNLVSRQRFHVRRLSTGLDKSQCHMELLHA
jgi:hypothetical protein